MMPLSHCVICDIVAGKLAADVIYEDTHTIAFLPLTMDTYGHTIVAPKAHSADMLSTPETTVLQVIVCAKQLAHQYKAILEATGFNLLHASGLSAQQSVPHLHIHLLPRYDNDGLNAWPAFPANVYDRAEIMAKLCLKAKR